MNALIGLGSSGDADSTEDIASMNHARAVHIRVWAIVLI